MNNGSKPDSMVGVGGDGNYKVFDPNLNGTSLADLVSYRHMLIRVFDALMAGREMFGFTNPINIPVDKAMKEAMQAVKKVDERITDMLAMTYDNMIERFEDEDLPF